MVRAPLTCADLFCGAGGFSEGFRQAGFRVTKALDIWGPAILTHEKNHSDTEAILGDILSYDPETLGPVDVLIGSPPCTEFSFANRGGGGDVEEGMRLVYRFLRFVHHLKPRWWVMENVPRVLDFLPNEIPLRKLGIDKKGVLLIPVREVLTSADFGAPQLRKRAFSGEFPMPAATHADLPVGNMRRWRTLREVVEGLPDPLRRPPSAARDPVYAFGIPATELTDHFSTELVLDEEEVRENRKAKEDHSWYGRMTFPDELDRPGRTVMATNLRVSRETTVIPASSGGYRRLSVRETSSVQGFPITYQWWGGTDALKYKLVGNAVAPPVAFAIAREILSAVARPLPAHPYVVESVKEPAPASRGTERRRLLPLTRRFREHIPGSKAPGFRVDLDNRGAPQPRRLVTWRTVLYRGSGKSLHQREVRLDEALQLFERAIPDRTLAHPFLAELEESLGEMVPDGDTLQRIRAQRLRSDVTPYLVLDEVAKVVTRHFGSESNVIRLRSPRDPDFIPVRIAATLVATSYVCALANSHPKRPRLALPLRHAGAIADTKPRSRQLPGGS